MALDGLTVAALTKEFADYLTEGRIQKIVQTEKDELFLTIKTAEDLGRGRQLKLYLSAQASLPLAYLCDESKAAPPVAPSFCMLLRKHLQNGRILSVSQPGLERVIRFAVEHRNEMGDLCRKTLLIELMGKYSNIIFLDENDRILDAIRRVPSSVSSVREVLPGRDYFIPSTQNKKNPLEADAAQFAECMRSQAQPLFQALYNSYTGLSSILAQEICFRSRLEADLPANELREEQVLSLFHSLEEGILDVVRSGDFQPEMIYENGTPREFSAVPLTLFEDMQKERMQSISEMLLSFYAKKNAAIRIRQKSSELRHVIQVHLERAIKKYDLQMQQWKDTEKREKFRLHGELLTAYAYQITEGLNEVELLDYHTGQMVKVRLDPTKSASENAQHFYEKYNKMKRTAEKLSVLTKETREEVDHLKSIQASLDLAENEADLMQIRREMIAASYLRGSAQERSDIGRRQGAFIPARGNISNKKKASARALRGSGKGRNLSDGKHRKEGKGREESLPLHFISEDGFDIYVGKNNYQNDQVTFHMADREDWWFHAKKMPGSHVILKSGGREIPDRAFEEAASLAAYYSSGREQGKVEVDYLQQKNVKKPSGAKPGFVIYYTNYSMVAGTDLSGLKQV